MVQPHIGSMYRLRHFYALFCLISMRNPARHFSRVVSLVGQPFFIMQYLFNDVITGLKTIKTVATGSPFKVTVH